MMLLIGMLRVLFREGQRKIEKKSIFHSCQYALPLRRRVTRQSYAEDRRHTRVGEKREKKIKNKAHSQHELHEESDEPKHDETCVKREKKEKKRTVSATPKEGKAPPCVDDDDDDDDDDEWEKEEEEEEEIRELRSEFCGGRRLYIERK